MLNSVFFHNKYFFFKIDKLSGHIIVTKCSRKMEYIAFQDITNFLYSVSIKYNIDLDVLLDRYLPIITIEKKKYTIKRTIKSRKPNVTIAQPTLQCCARKWDNGNVAFDDTNKEWTYGAQCTKTKYGSARYCPQHLKLIEKHGALVHGDFFQPPPHPHYEKFKKK